GAGASAGASAGSVFDVSLVLPAAGAGFVPAAGLVVFDSVLFWGSALFWPAGLPSAAGASTFSASPWSLLLPPAAAFCAPSRPLKYWSFSTRNCQPVRHASTTHTTVTPIVSLVKKSPAFVPKALCPPRPPNAPASP